MGGELYFNSILSRYTDPSVLEDDEAEEAEEAADEEDAGDAVDEAMDTGVEAVLVGSSRLFFAGVVGGCSCAGGAVRFPVALRGIVIEAKNE